MARDGRFRWSAALVFVLLTLSLITGVRHYTMVKEPRDAARRAERERWLNQGEKSPHGAAHHGLFVFKPLSLLSAVDTGIEPYVGEVAFLEAHHQRLFQHKPAEDSSALRRFGELTAAVVLQTLIPLLIVLLTYPVFVGEREQGTLRQTLSAGVSKRELVVGKTLGGAFILFLALIPATLAGVAAMALNRASLQGLSRLPLMALGYLAYFAVVVGITLIVSALASTSRQALVSLLALWFVNCLMAPQVVTDLARRVYPAPNPVKLVAAMKEEEMNLVEWNQRLADVERRLLRQYGVDSARDLPVNPKGVALQEDEDDSIRIAQKHINGLYEIHERQTRLYQAGAIVSPMIAAQSFSMGLAGTDFAHHYHFARAAEDYRRMLVRKMNEDQAANDDPENVPYEDEYTAGRFLWESVPPFEYSAPGLGWVIGQQRLGVMLLLFWLVAVAVALPLALSRLKVG